MRRDLEALLLEPARATCDIYIESTPTDGVPYWDTGAPGLAKLRDWASRPAEPFNEFEPVDSSAAAIAAQGLLRLARWLEAHGAPAAGQLWLARKLLGRPKPEPEPDE